MSKLFRTEEHADGLQQIWIDTGFSPSEMLALKASSQEMGFEVVGITDANRTLTRDALEKIEQMGYVLPIGSENQEALREQVEEDLPGELLYKSAVDVGRMSVAMLSGTKNASAAYRAHIEALEADPEWDEDALEDEDVRDAYADTPFGTVYWNLGEIVDQAGDHYLTTVSKENPSALEEGLALGVQRLVLDPKVATELDPPEALADISSHWDALLTIYMALEPQAFVFEERGVHIHTNGEEKGWFHFVEGEGVLVASAVNASAFFEWVNRTLR